MKTTSGIFLINKNNELLIGHPTHHPEKFWSIPKGEFEYPSNPFQEALRELNEETNVLLSSNLKYHTLDPKIYKSNKKILHSFIIFESENELDLSKFNLKCNSFFKYKDRMLPEFDKIKWTSTKKAIDLVHESQKDQLKHIYSSFQF